MATFELLTNQMGEMKLSVEGLEKERDFYFNKVSLQTHPSKPNSGELILISLPSSIQLREIEIIIGARLESPEGQDMVDLERDTLLQMQAILYSTEVRSPSSCKLPSTIETSHISRSTD